MREGNLVNLILGIILACCTLSTYWVNAEDPYRYFTFQITYGTRAPLGVQQKVSFSTFLYSSLSIYILIYLFCIGNSCERAISSPKDRV